MKIKIHLLALLLIFSACSSEKEEKIEVADFSADSFPIQWELTEMSTMLVGSQTSGDDLPYNEYYVLKEDNTFTKTRVANGNALKAFGNYSLTSINNDEYFKLEYSSPNDLVESCSSSTIEHLIIDSSTKIRGTANACDWPSKIYRRVN